MVAPGLQQLKDVRRTGYEVAIFGHDLDILRHETLIDPRHGLIIGLGALRLLPALCDVRLGQHLCDVIAFGQPHRLARIRDRHLDAEIRKRLDEGPHWREGSEVDHGAGPVEDDGLDLIHGSGSSLCAKKVGDGLLADREGCGCAATSCDDDEAYALQGRVGEAPATVRGGVCSDPVADDTPSRQLENAIEFVEDELVYGGTAPASGHSDGYRRRRACHPPTG